MEVFCAIAGFALYIFLVIMAVRAFGWHVKVKKLRQGKCIFQGTALENELIKSGWYRKKDKEVYKTGMQDGNFYIEKNPTVIKGEYVKGDSVYRLKSESLGYEIERSELPFEKNITPKWTMDSTDTPTYKKMDKISFRLISAGTLTEKQTKKLQKVIARADYER